MFGRRKPKVEPEQPAPPRQSVLGGFGKLPSEADFVSVDTQWREVRELDDLVQRTFSELSRSQSGEALHTRGLLMTGGGDRQGLVAWMYPSQDKAGRAYPFVLFNRIAVSHYNYKPEAYLTEGTQRLVQIAGSRESLQVQPETQWLDALRAVPEYQTPMDVRVARREAMAHIEAASLVGWLDALVGPDPSAQKRFLCQTHALLQQLKQGRIHRAYHGIWLPLGHSDCAQLSLSFWVQLLSGAMANAEWRPDFIWSTEDNNHRLFVLTKPLTQSSLLATSTPQLAVQSFLGWQDLADVSVQSSSLAHVSQQWLAKPDTSLLDVAIDWYQQL